jgi:hypothetical protein
VGETLNFKQANDRLVNDDLDMADLVAAAESAGLEYPINDDHNSSGRVSHAVKTLSIATNCAVAQYFERYKIPGLYQVLVQPYSKHYSDNPVPSPSLGVAYIPHSRPYRNLAALIDNFQLSHFLAYGEPMFDAAKIHSFMEEINRPLKVR